MVQASGRYKACDSEATEKLCGWADLADSSSFSSSSSNSLDLQSSLPAPYGDCPHSRSEGSLATKGSMFFVEDENEDESAKSAQPHSFSVASLSHALYLPLA